MQTLTLAPQTAQARQRGVVLVFALIALVILLIGAAAMVRSMSTAQFSIGNLGFKRDMANQGERAMERVIAEFNTGGLASALARESNLPASNYSAVMLTNNAQGLPVALLTDAGFAAVGVSGKDITTDVGVTIRYVIDRMSTAAGPCGPDTCVMATQSIPGGSFSEWNNAQNNNGVGGVGAAPPQPVYRVTVRVNGPRGTQSFFQSTFTI
jgi:hypothetical protein